tara:strand:- start:2945 stop:3604 length:660 start_codon:yes stop_codon:yes gene_type:complete
MKLERSVRELATETTKIKTGPENMNRRTRSNVYPVSESTREPVVQDGVLGMIIFVVAEVMMFAGFISGFAIVKSQAPLWPPPGQPRLPLEETALNTLALLASGVVLFVAQKKYRKDPDSCSKFLLGAICLGLFFVGSQGVEWIALIKEGLTLTSSALGSFFYSVVGLHALHAVVAIFGVGYAWYRLNRGWLPASVLNTAAVFWYFVVGVWPALYLTMYL